MALTPSELSGILAERILVADGAMGTVLQARDVPPPYDRANLANPDAVLAVHAEYVCAGARLLETNTFGANAIKLAAFALDDRVEEINRRAVRLARAAAAGAGALVAGAIGPCGKALAPVGAVRPDLAEQAFREQAAALLEEGVDLIVLETFNDLDELRIAHRVVRDLADVAIVATKVFIEDGETLSGGLPGRVAAEVAAWDGVVAVGANCAIGPQRMLAVVRGMAEVCAAPLSAMPTPGLPQRIGNAIRYAVTPEYFARYARQLAEAGAGIIGGCCGTGPAHIEAIAGAVAEIRPVSREARERVVVREREAAERPAPSAAPSALRQKLGREYLTTVELDLPRGLDISRVLEGARALKERGVDMIDISDGARARLRMNATSVAHLVHEQTGVEVMVHFACRDRNLLAVQADLLGAHALGVRNILAVTGDPANIGDYPSATSVYDVDSVGLVRILRRFNEGIDLAGNGIGQPTSFTIAVAFDPLADDAEGERRRLQRKVEEGAEVVYTQPVFERRVLDVAVAACAEVGVPLLFGLLPLRSARHCEFMHNEVPGIRIPEGIRARMGELSEEDGRRYGLDVARQFLLDARSHTQGVYLMPPFGNHKVAEAVLRALA
ncbi:MAG: bifunctional homocysteine S-methyltransferase/methylenetetrahydrofolate reductase [Chthonomonadales bacterium]|nr:bifunctional homocysteine S-methyltransferase/methylenetetrahydrofolate reductase [Chthonomonadales bacterium]